MYAVNRASFEDLGLIIIASDVVNCTDIGLSKARAAMPFKIVNDGPLTKYELICLPLYF